MCLRREAIWRLRELLTLKNSYNCTKSVNVCSRIVILFNDNSTDFVDENMCHGRHCYTRDRPDDKRRRNNIINIFFLI